MNINRRSKIISVVSVFVLLFMVGSGQATSVNVGGLTFTADLGDEWMSAPEPAMEYGQDQEGFSTDANGVSQTFKFVEDQVNVFYLPDKDNPSQSGTGVEIAVYKVPVGERVWNAHDILYDFLGEPQTDESQKDIEFGGRPAILNESDGFATIAVLMPDNTIVVIYDSATKESGLTPWDLINKITISPK